MQFRRSREATNPDQRKDFQPDFAYAEKNHNAADKDLELKRRRDARRRQRAQFRHVPIGAQDDGEFEQKRNRDEADRLDRAQRAITAGQRRERPGEVNRVADRRVRFVETQHVGPRSRQLPEAEIIVALKREDRESRRVEQNRPSRPNAEQRPPPEREAGRARQAGDNPISRAQRNEHRKRDEQRADQRERQRRNSRARRHRVHRHRFRAVSRIRLSMATHRAATAS